MSDIMIANHGSIITMAPVSSAGLIWMREHIPEDAQYLGNCLCVEPRYAPDILIGMVDDGLIIGY